MRDEKECRDYGMSANGKSRVTKQVDGQDARRRATSTIICMMDIQILTGAIFRRLNISSRPDTFDHSRMGQTSAPNGKTPQKDLIFGI